jgi:hypothetical protein
VISQVLVRALEEADEARIALASPASARVAAELLERYGDSDQPQKSPEELEALLQRLRMARFEWAATSPSDRTDIVWVLWQGDDPPAGHPAFLRSFLRWIEIPWRRVQARRLASSWAAAFDRTCSSIAEVGVWLEARAHHLGDPWLRLADEFAVFSPRGGALALARAFLAREEAAKAFWHRLSLPPRASVGGLPLAAIGSAAALVRPRLLGEAALAARLIDFASGSTAFCASNDAIDVRPALVTATRAQLAETLLLPWRSAVPPEEVKEEIVCFLLGHYGDPRAKWRNWEGVAPEAAKILHCWLNREAVDVFFKLAAKTKKDQWAAWPMRARFWRAAADQLDDAWLILGSHCDTMVGRRNRNFGQLVGGGAEHCALLAKLRGLTIVIASNSEHERVWLPGNQKAPPRYHGPRRSYSAASLTTGADFSSIYAANDGDLSPRHLCDFVARHTGVALEKSLSGLSARRQALLGGG